MAPITGVPQPFPYQGSKRLLASYILNCFPIKFNRLVEPFAGSAAISLATAKSNRAKKFVIADANGPLITLWEEIVHNPAKLSDQYETLWYDQHGREKEFYNIVRREFNQKHLPGHFLYLLARCVKAAIRYNSRGEFNNSPDNRRMGMKPQTMRQKIHACSVLLKERVTFKNEDYRKVLASTVAGDVVYMDPPYQGVCGKRDIRYLQQTNFETFVESLEELNKRGIPFVVSYDGKLGDKSYGQELPAYLKLMRHEIKVGRSTTSTLLGRSEHTVESLYLSETLSDLYTVASIKSEGTPSLFANIA